MKNCINCGTEAPDDAPTCPQCDREFAYKGNTSNAVEWDPNDASVTLRPDGSNLKTYGGAAFAIGVAALFFGWFYPSSEYSYGDSEPSRLALKANVLLLGGALVQIGAVSWLVGHIVEAISFLPGKDTK